VRLFVPPYDSPEDAGLCWREGGVTVVNVPLPPGVATGNGYWQLRLAWRLLAEVRAWRPDVVHAFKPKGPSGLVAAALWQLGRCARAAALCRRSGVSPPGTRLVVDSDDWEGPGGWNDDRRTGYTSAQRRVFAWQERYGLSHAGAWTAASGCLCQRAIALGADPSRVFKLPNGFTGNDRPDDLQRCPASPQKDGPQKAPSVLLYTRFAGVRPEDVAQIWRLVSTRAPAAKLVIAGRGMGGEEWELARRLSGVEVAGWTEPQFLPALFAGQELAIVPWADTLPNRARCSAKVLELMAAGLPIVASEVGELPTMLAGCGLVVPPGDHMAFAEAILALLADPEHANRLGAAARACARTTYNWDRLAEIALEAYAAASC
jgi:glycosyltransferase involved in cell wall biosynthesis